MKYTFLIILCCAFVACKKKTTSWDSHWKFPLVTDTLSLKKYIKSGNLEVQNDNSMLIKYNKEVFSFSLSDEIKIPDTSVVQTYTIPIVQLSVNPGFGFVNNIEEFEFDLGDVELNKVILRKGFVELNVENPIEAITVFEINLPGVSLNGVDFNKVIEVPAKANNINGKKNVVLNLGGYTLDLKGQTGNSFNKLQSQMIVSTKENSPTVVVTGSDEFKFEIKMKDLEMDYARGYFGNFSLKDTTNVDLSLLNIVAGGAVDIEDLDLEIDIDNGVFVTGRARLTQVTSKNAAGDVLALTHPLLNTNQNLNSATGDWNSITPYNIAYTMNSSNSNIEEFVEHLGKAYAVGYDVEINPWGNTSGGFDEVFPKSKIGVSVNVEMPFKLGTNGLTLADTLAYDVSQNLDKTHIKSGELVLDVKNSFPFNAEIVLELLDDAGQVLFVLQGDKIVESSSNAFPSTSEALAVKNSKVTYTLSNQNMIDINGAKKIVVKGVFNSTNQTIQTVHANAELIFQLITNFTLENNI